MARSERGTVCLRGVGVAVAALFLAAMPCRTVAQTNGEIVSRACPVAYAAGREQSRAAALADDSQYGLAKKAAGLFYDCYQTLNDGWVKDAAHLEYLFYLSFSVPSDNERQLSQMLLVVISGANELAASTQDSGVRKQAIMLRDSCRKQLNGLLESPP